jgi:tellurite resistance protein TehA-like permease
VLFWIYVALAFLSAVFQYLFLFAGPRLTVQSMTPAWILPVFPIMLSATIATLISPALSPSRRMPVIVAGLRFQGLGWMIAFVMYAIYTHRLMAYGLPAPNLRPGMFIPVGPPSFTGLVLIGLAKAVPENYGYFASRPIGVEVVRTIADFTAIFLWVLAFWFFCIALVAVLQGARKMSFHMVWWACVFPNAGFAIATISIGEQLESEGILWVGSTMTILIVVAWVFIFAAQMRAVWRRQILMPGKDEDKGE